MVCEQCQEEKQGQGEPGGVMATVRQEQTAAQLRAPDCTYTSVSLEPLTDADSVAPTRDSMGLGPKVVRGWHQYSQKALQVVLRGSQTETQ